MGGKRVYELMIEIGHRSTPLKSKLPNGYTHKWTAFVRGRNNAKIENCIQRVVFQLHDSFDKPHRDISEPPFQIKETGYAGFEIPIEIYFKNKEKANHVVFVYDLCLLTDRPHDQFVSHKLKFKHPNKEFEKCLIRSGAQLLSTTKEKKERSHSPPTKKQKSSSSLIPSKDMSKQPPSSNQSQQQQPLPTQQQQQQPQHHSQQQPQLHRKTTSKEFMDVFGAPLVYNSSHSNNNNTTSQKQNSRETEQTRETQSFIKEEPHQQLPQSSSRLSHTQTNPHSHSHSQHQQQHQPQHQTSTQVKLEPQTQSHLQTPAHSQSQPPQQQQSQLVSSQTDALQIIQTKISSLSDCDRLQKIVDIIEESGEWFIVTSKKFEFDLKRLDKKTLSKIEKCLSNPSNHHISANYKR